jgi:phage gp29-like protein
MAKQGFFKRIFPPYRILKEEEIKEDKPKRGPGRRWLVTRRTAIDATHTPIGTLTDGDEVLRLAGLHPRHAFDEIVTDDHLTAVKNSRLAAVNSLEWDIVRDKASARVHKAVLKQFEQSAGNRRIDMQNLFRETMEKNDWGYAPIKLDWKLEEGRWWIQSFTGLPSWWFKFNDANEIRFMSVDAPTDGEEAPKYRLIVARNNPTYENPYGEKLLSKSYWPVTWKRNVIKWWNIFVEKFSIPALVGRVPNRADQADIDKVLDMLDQMVADTVMVLEEDTKFETLEPSGKRASADLFLRIIQYMDSALSKIWLGETLTTELQDKGAYAASKTHEGVKNERRDTDKHEIEYVVNTAIRWFVDINFGDVPAPEFIMSEPFEHDKTKAEIDSILAEKLGVKFNKAYIAAEYGKDEDHFEIVEPKPKDEGGEGFEFSSADEKAIDAAFKNLDDKELQKQAVQILQPVIDLIEKSGTYGDALDSLLKVAPKMNLTGAQKAIERAISISEAWGRVNAQ